MPPVENVPLDELVRRVQEDLRARAGRIVPDPGSRVLELIAEAERASRLVEGRARPEPAGEHLVEEPAVHHHVERRVGGLDADAAERVAPEPARRGESAVHGLARGVAGDERVGVRAALSFAEQEVDLDLPSGRDLQPDRQRRTRLAGGARGSRCRAARAAPAAAPATVVAVAASSSAAALAPVVAVAAILAVATVVGVAADVAAPQRFGTRHFAGRSKEGPAVRREDVPAGRRHERDRLLVAALFRVAGAHHAGARLDLDGRRRLLRKHAEDEPRVPHSRQPPRPAAGIPQAQTHDLDRILGRHEERRLVHQALPGDREPAGSESVPHLVAGGERRRARQRRPDPPRLVIAQIQRLVVGIGHSVVGPRRQAVLAAVAAPGEAGAAFAHEEPGALVGDDVDPGARRQEMALAVQPAQSDDVLAPVRREAAERIGEEERLRPVTVTEARAGARTAARADVRNGTGTAARAGAGAGAAALPVARHPGVSRSIHRAHDRLSGRSAGSASASAGATGWIDSAPPVPRCTRSMGNPSTSQ